MSPLVEEAFRAIESGSSQVVEEGFLTLAEVVAVNRIQNFQSDIIPEANAEVLEWAPLHEIQQRVQRWIEAHPDDPSVCSAFWVLDKFRDEALLPFLQHWLRQYVERIMPYLHPLGQILVDLDSLGQHSISEGSYSSSEVGKNLDDAIKYISAIKPKA